MTPTNTPAPASEAADVERVASWSYSINYGPDGEENWANLITPEGDHVANIRTHHAMRIVAALASPSTEVERLTRERDRALELADKYKWQVLDTCTRAETAEATNRSLKERLAEAERRAMVTDIAKAWPYGTHFSIEHDGFAGRVIGWYVRLDGKAGVVGQIDGARIVHVYGDKWLSKRKEGRSNG